ncbi:MAG: DNA polymerase IV [Opitutales bacterium]|nr:DNA polymerase IV [Opitutales bacterium]
MTKSSVQATSSPSSRKIIHIDMDCFYAAIECRDDPSVAHLPVGVGGESGRGVLTTCNYRAREFGCHSAMPVFKARQLCPQIILKPVRFEAYRAEARKIRAIFARYTKLIEPLSLDEAFLDVTGHPEFAWKIARQIRQAIREETGLTASAGIAPNKMLAKIASDWRKPDGQFAVLPKDIATFMKDLPVRKLWGIGPKSAALLEEQGVRTCGDLQEWPIPRLIGFFGQKWGNTLHELARGKDERPVEIHRPRKSLSTEMTLPKNLETLEECEALLPELLETLEEDMTRMIERKPFRKIFLKLKFADFRTTTCERPATNLDRSAFAELLREAFGRHAEAVRLVGLGVRFPEAVEVPNKQLVFPFFDR